MGNDGAVNASIFEALKSSGSYFTTKPEAVLVVIPKLEIVVSPITAEAYAAPPRFHPLPRSPNIS